MRRALMIGTDLKAIRDTVLPSGPLNVFPISEANPSVHTPLEELPAETRLLFDYNPDLGGLDVFCIIADRLFKVISDAHEPPQELKEMVNAGKLGLKSGQGFFSDPDKRVKERDKKHMQLLKLWYL